MPRSLTVACLAVALVLGGCGTILNLKSPNPEIYGGVAKDIEYASTSHPATPSSSVQIEKRSLFLLWVADFGLSAVGDTLTIPVVLCHALFVDKTPAEASTPSNTAAQFGVGAVAPAARSRD
jgi:uncharacterized protein YceK